MCSTYRIKGPLGEILDSLGIDLPADMVWDELIHPTSRAPSVVERDGHLEARLMQFSMIPRWSKERRPKFATHNARVESAADKSTWKKPLQEHRCIVPISEFVEPIYEGEYAGNMVRFFPADGALLFAAGVWDRWKPRGPGGDGDGGGPVESFAVLTRPPVDFVRTTGHDRMPLFVEPAGAVDAWLGGGSRQAAELIDVLRDLAVEPTFAVGIERPMAKGWERRRDAKRKKRGDAAG